MNDAENWRELCEWLNARKRKCAYSGDIPSHLQYLICTQKLADRRRVDLVQYHTGWGWRLRENWREKVAKWNLPEPAST